MSKERRDCIRRQEDKDILTRLSTMLIEIQSEIKLLKGNDELIIFRLLQIEKKLGIYNE